MNGIDSEVPAKCTVRQAAYVVRHGSRCVCLQSYATDQFNLKMLDSQTLARIIPGLRFTTRYAYP